MHVDIISFEGLYEALSHPVGLRASDGRKAGDEVEPRRKVQRFSGRVGATVISQELDRCGSSLGIEASLDCQHHDIADRLSSKSSFTGLPGKDFSIRGVDHEGHPDHLSVPARNLKAIGCPAGVRVQGNDLALMGSAARVFARVLGQQQIVMGHDPVDALVIDQRLAPLGRLSIAATRR